MPIDNGYATLAEVKDWCGPDSAVTVHDDKLEAVVTSVSRWIDTYCQRHFWLTDPEARVFAAKDSGLLKLGPFNDLESLTSLATDETGDGTFATTWTAADYELLPINQAAAPEPRPWEKIRSTGTRSFPLPSGTGRSARVQITGAWGWTAVPATVKQACLIQSSRIFKRKDSPEGVAGFGDFGAIRVSGRLDPDVEDLLDPYRHPAAVALVA